MKLVDPLAILKQRVQNKEVATAVTQSVPYEIPMSPPPGAKVLRLTIASTYRTPIQVIFDPATRTTFPIST